MPDVTVTVKSYRKELVEKLHKHLGQNLDAGSRILRDEIREKINVVGFGVPSKPGEPPRLQTGTLWRSYFAATDFVELIARVGSPLPQALGLEVGNLRVAPRPHVRRTLYGSIALRRALTRPLY